MMYKNDMIASLKADGKILREQDQTVFIPFGSEYSLYIKNLRAVKAVVRISIDGQSVLGSHELIVQPNSIVDLERFIEDGDMNKGNRFKFIQKTEKIQAHRGDKIDDGIVRIEFQYEKPRQEPLMMGGMLRGVPKSYVGPSTGLPTATFNDGGTAAPESFMSKSGTISGQMMPLDYGEATLDSMVPLADEGITVKGSESQQSFRYGSVGELESAKHVITLQLKGVTPSGNEVKAPLTVKTKLVCPTCGTSNKSSLKYCGECGTFLN